MAADPQPNPTPPPTRPPRQPSDADRTEWYRLAGIGFEFIAAVLMIGGLGWWLDTRWNTSPWLLISGVGLGFALGLYLLIREARRAFHD